MQFSLNELLLHILFNILYYYYFKFILMSKPQYSVRIVLIFL